MSTEDKISSDELTDLIGRVRVSFGGFEDADALIAEAERFAARLAEVEAERDAATKELARWTSGQRLKALRQIAAVPDGLQYAAALVRAQGTEGGEAHDNLLAEAGVRLRDLSDAARHLLAEAVVLRADHARTQAELEVARPVVEAADAWRGENNGKGLVLPPTSDRIDALIAAVDLHRSIRNLDSAVPEPSFATETLTTTTGEKP